MQLESVILDVLLEDSAHAFTFDEVVEDVAKRLEPEVREILNNLYDRQAIHRHQGGRDHPWRYQAKPIYRR